MQALAAERGTTTVDILVNNAAICLRGTIEETTEALFDEVMDVNAKVPFFLIQKVLPRMPDGGRIINISSQTSLIAFPGIAAYTMTKGALDRLTLVAAKHLAPRGITVNALLPGVADTDMNLSWLRGKPEVLRPRPRSSAPSSASPTSPTSPTSLPFSPAMTRAGSRAS